MKVRWFFAILLIGAALSVLGMVCSAESAKQPQPAFQLEPPDDPWGDLADVLHWCGVAGLIVGSLGLFFCGVRRSRFIGRPGY